MGPDLLILHQSGYMGSEGDFIAGGVFRVARSSGRVLWSAWVQGNTGEPLRKGQFLYVTGSGFVGKLDVESGRYAWQHKDLYRSPGLYNSFEVARFSGGTVLFPAVNANAPAKARWPEVLAVDDATGRIVEGAPSR